MLFLLILDTRPYIFSFLQVGWPFYRIGNLIIKIYYRARGFSKITNNKINHKHTKITGYNRMKNHKKLQEVPKKHKISQKISKNHKKITKKNPKRSPKKEWYNWSSNNKIT